jgi:hypothetical protein
MIPWTSCSDKFSDMANGAKVATSGMPSGVKFVTPGITRPDVSGASSLSPVSPEDSSSDSAKTKIALHVGPNKR